MLEHGFRLPLPFRSIKADNTPALVLVSRKRGPLASFARIALHRHRRHRQCVIETPPAFDVFELGASSQRRSIFLVFLRLVPGIETYNMGIIGWGGW